MGTIVGCRRHPGPHRRLRTPSFACRNCRAPTRYPDARASTISSLATEPVRRNRTACGNPCIREHMEGSRRGRLAARATLFETVQCEGESHVFQRRKLEVCGTDGVHHAGQSGPMWCRVCFQRGFFGQTTGAPWRAGAGRYQMRMGDELILQAPGSTADQIDRPRRDQKTEARKRPRPSWGMVQECRRSGTASLARSSPVQAR